MGQQSEVDPGTPVILSLNLCIKLCAHDKHYNKAITIVWGLSEILSHQILKTVN